MIKLTLDHKFKILKDGTNRLYLAIVNDDNGKIEDATMVLDTQLTDLREEINKVV